MPLFKRFRPRVQTNKGDQSKNSTLEGVDSTFSLYACALSLSHDDEVWKCQFSPVNDTILLTTTYGKVTLWNLETSTPLAEVIGADGYCSATFSPDGKSIACSFGDNQISIGAVDKNLKKLKKIKPPHEIAFGNSTRALQYFGNDLLVSASWDSHVRVWKIKKGKLAASTDVCEFYKQPVKQGLWWCCPSPDGSILAIATSTSDIYLIEADSLALRATLSGHESDVYHCEFSRRHGHKVLLSGSKDGTVRIWDTDVGKCARVHETGFPVKACLLSEDGTLLAAGGDAFQVILLDPDTGTTIYSLKLDDESFHHAVFGLSMARSGRYLAAAYTDSKVRVWRLADRRTLKHQCRLFIRALVAEPQLGHLPVDYSLKCYLQFSFDCP
eukprot:m.311942 g.311942  ORF g.311942 m.311942 type:complete len:384 (+) comp178911_c0_seq1:28-1179(+)